MAAKKISLTIVAGVSGDQLLKGFGAACFGLLLATVGLDTVYGTNRIVFSEVELMSGLNFIPVLIGLFALPEIIASFARREGLREHNPLAGSGATWTDFKHCLKTIIRGSFIGVVLGAIPGIGGAPAAFLSYSEAKRNSPKGTSLEPGNWKGWRQLRAVIMEPLARPWRRCSHLGSRATSRQRLFSARS